MARKKKIVPRYGPRLIGYARVSTEEQNLMMQIDALTKAGVHPDDIFAEKVSGASKRRPALELLTATIQPGDTLLVLKLDRLGRSMADVIRRVEWLTERSIVLKTLDNFIDTSNGMGRFLLYILAAVAELEREMTRERTMISIAARKARGLVVGAPRKFTEEHIAQAEAMFREGKLIGEVRRHFGVSANTVYHYLPPKVIKRLAQEGPVKRRK